MNVQQVLPRDAIPSVDDPSFVTDYDGRADDEVIVVDVVDAAVADDTADAADGGEVARAYPVRYLHYHEIVNDRVGDVPVAVTWCPLCGSAVVYDRRVSGEGESRILEFGVSGKLADDDLVMYDRETESEWKQSLGRCIAGPLEGHELDVLPASLTTWGRFRETHPEGVVLAPPGGASEAASDTDDPAPIDYDAAPYEAYFEMEGFGLGAHRGDDSRDWNRTDLDPKTVVLGVESGGEAIGFPLPVVEAEGGVVTATVGDVAAVVFAGDGGVHAFERPTGFEFRRGDGTDDGDVTADSDVTDGDDDQTGRFVADGTTWDGATGVGADGRQLVRLPARRLFAFAWQDDHGRDAFFGVEG
ncbi:DUF3179 domain-containing protein [Halobium salinum]|uniref:DUF3179 domain-containing protein n=1 Tax=Halobium salinum TaxID=1364940 RepID=A0ABD5PDL7_9EURY|nr:DUF3179 domain-containing protein [Halobium salinum]